MRSKDQENSAHRVPCLIELFACLGMLVFRLPLRKIIEIKAYFYTVRHEIFVRARCHRRKMFLTACVKDMEVLTALLTKDRRRKRGMKREIVDSAVAYSWIPQTFYLVRLLATSLTVSPTMNFMFGPKVSYK